ncbi:MAG: hypothetical protein ACYTG0_18495 [Planctomycetota bacterium]
MAREIRAQSERKADDASVLAAIAEQAEGKVEILRINVPLVGGIFDPGVDRHKVIDYEFRRKWFEWARRLHCRQLSIRVEHKKKYHDKERTDATVLMLRDLCKAANQSEPPIRILLRNGTGLSADAFWLRTVVEQVRRNGSENSRENEAREGGSNIGVLLDFEYLDYNPTNAIWQLAPENVNWQRVYREKPHQTPPGSNPDAPPNAGEHSPATDDILQAMTLKLTSLKKWGDRVEDESIDYDRYLRPILPEVGFSGDIAIRFMGSSPSKDQIQLAIEMLESFGGDAGR